MKYRCHKTVDAFQIRKIVQNPLHPESRILMFHEDGADAVVVHGDFLAQSPFVGGYYVLDERGNESFINPGEFNATHTRI